MNRYPTLMYAWEKEEKKKKEAKAEQTMMNATPTEFKQCINDPGSDLAGGGGMDEAFVQVWS